MNFNHIFNKREKHEKFKFVAISDNATFKDSICIALDNIFISLEEAIHNLTEKQLHSFSVENHGCVGWIAMHILGNIEYYVNHMVTGKPPITGYGGMFGYGANPREADVPSLEKIILLLNNVRNNSYHVLDSIKETHLLENIENNPINWKRTILDAYNRVINHAHAHINQIWLLKGVLRIKSNWPQQHWA